MPPVPVVRADGAAIRRRRQELGLKPEDVAAPILRHAQTIRQLENGRLSHASEKLMAQLATVLRCDVAELTLHGKSAA